MKMNKLLSSALLGVFALSCLVGVGVNAKAADKELDFTVTINENEKPTQKLIIKFEDVNGEVAVEGLQKAEGSTKGISVKNYQNNGVFKDETKAIKEIQAKDSNKVYEVTLNTAEIKKSGRIDVKIEKDGYKFEQNGNEPQIFAKELSITKVEADGSIHQTSTQIKVTLNTELPANLSINAGNIELKRNNNQPARTKIDTVQITPTNRKEIVLKLKEVTTETDILLNFAGGFNIDGYDILINDNKTVNLYKATASGQQVQNINITSVRSDGNANTATSTLTVTLDKDLPNGVTINPSDIELKKGQANAKATVKKVEITAANRKQVVITLNPVKEKEENVVVNFKNSLVVPNHTFVKNTDKKVTIHHKNTAPTPAPNPNPTPNQNTGSSGGGFIAPQPSTETSKENTETKSNNSTKDTSNKTEDKKVEKQIESNDDEDISSGTEEVNTTVKVNGTENLKAKVSSKKIEDALDNEQSVVVKNSKQRIEIGTKALKEITKNGKAFNLEIKKTANTANVALKEKKAFDFSINKKMLNLKNAVTVSLPYSSGNAKVFVIGKDGKAKQINGVKYDKKTKTLKFKTKTIGKIVNR